MTQAYITTMKRARALYRRAFSTRNAETGQREWQPSRPSLRAWVRRPAPELGIRAAGKVARWWGYE